MYSTGPMFLSDVVKKHNNVVGILPGSKFMAYNSNEDISIIKKGAVLIPLEGKSWNSLDSHILNKVNQYKKHILVILIIIYIYLIVSYIKFMRRK
jgi:hypothetical protein